MATRGTFISRTFLSLGHRDYRLVWLGSVSEHFGEWMELVALLWLVNELTHSPFMLTLAGSCRYIPMIVFPIIAGMIVDTMDRRRMLIAALLGAALLSIILAVLVKTGVVEMWHIIVLSLLHGITTSLNHPARQTIVPNLVKKEHLLNAVSLDSASVQASRFLATPIAGYLIDGFGVVPVFGARAAGALLAVCLLLFVKTPLKPPAAARKAPWVNVADGLKYVRRDVLLLSLVPLYLIPMLTQNTTGNFLPVIAQDILKISATGYGFLQSAPGFGALASLIALAALPFDRLKGSLLFTAGSILGLALVLFSFSTSFTLSLFLLFVIGAMITSFMTINTALIQSHVSDAMRGRVMSLREISFGLGPSGSLIFGAIAEAISVPFSLQILGLVCIGVSVSLFLTLTRLRFAKI